MKRIFTLFFAVWGLCAVAQTPVAPAGSGTVGDPYQIATLDNLAWVSTNTSAWSRNSVQVADIDASATSGWNLDGTIYLGFSPIGSGSGFTGTYNGQGHTISGLTINRSAESYVGLFGYVSGAGKISNLGLVSVNIKGYNSVGCIAGQCDGTITNSYTTGTVVGTAGSAGRIGGLVGDLWGGINGSYSAVVVSGSQYVGGLVGSCGSNSTTSTITNSYSTGNVTGSSIVGGLAGYLYQGSVTNSYSTGNVGVNAVNGIAGGFLGSSLGGTVTNCFWNTIASGQIASAGGTGETTAEMKTQGTFTPWDFSSVWGIDGTTIKNNGYPYLSWQYPANPCVNPTSGGTIATDQYGSIPYDPLVLTNIVSPSNYLGTVEYKWQKSTTSGDAGYTDIANSNLATCDPGIITETTWYKRLARTTCMSGWGGAAASNVVKITVSPASVGGNVTGGVSPITYGNPIGLLTLRDYSGTVVKWEKRVGTNSWVDINNTGDTYSETPASAGTWQYRALVKSGISVETYSNPVNIVVVPQTLIVTAEDKSKIYDGAGFSSFTVSYNGFVLGETAAKLNGALVYSGSATTAVNAGKNYEIISGGLTSSNYSISFVPGKLTIAKKVLTVMAVGPSKEYGTTLISSSGSTNFIAGVTGVGSEIVTGVTLTPDAAGLSPATPAGAAYAVNPSLATGTGGFSESNYSITYMPYNGVVSKKALMVVADNKSKTYGSLLPALTVSYIGLANGEKVPANPPTVSTPATASSPVAAYVINVSGAADPNYVISYTTGILTVNKAELVIAADNKSKNYGSPLPALTISYTGLVNGDIAPSIKPTISTTALELSPVGSYPILISGAADPNYSISYSSGVLAVTKIPLTVVADELSKVYGMPDPILTYTSDKTLIGGSTFTGTLSRSFGENVGSYAINIGTLSAGANYDITFVSKSLRITAKLLTITNPALTMSRIYNGGTAASVTAGSLIGLVAGDETKVGVSAIANYTTQNVGVGIPINVVYSLSGGASDNYIKPADYFVSTGEITAKQLTVSNTVVTTNKMYDGTTSALVEKAGILSGVESGDVSNIGVSAIANYNDAKVGISKSITVIYTLTGSGAANYIVPSNLQINNAKISEFVVLNTLQSPGSGCEGTDLELSYTVLKGTPVQYQIVFGTSALAEGFKQTGYTNLISTGSNGLISIPVSSGTPYGTYQASLQMRNELGVVSDVYPFQFVVNVSSDYIIPKFDDVVLCNNKANNFSAFQWYKNGKAIDGATKQYYSDPNGLVGSYSLKVMTTNGQEYFSCPKVLNTPLKSKVTVSIFPNPVKVNQESTVKISGLSDDELNGARMTIYNIQGIQVYSTSVVNELNPVTLPFKDGVYIGNITTANGNKYSYQIILLK